MSAKLRIKAKGIEIEWEGELEFLRSEVPDLVASIIQAIGTGTAEENDEAEEAADTNGTSQASTTTFTTAGAAAKLKVKSAPELFKIALAKLQASDSIEPATREQILHEMKKAPRVYNSNMNKNLSQTIDGLLSRNEINEPSHGQYALSHNTYERLIEKLRQ
ncbi:hypothetical protein [Bradyrhizobium sp. HKCCYLS2033]|uniref:hypothetical protein n=1 Tax=unclassified Bradyrhizobium TaxID=2631580 RepID=UPI003EBB1E6F